MCDENAIGQYVYVVVPENEHMTVCEVEVFGLRKETAELEQEEINRALGGQTWQSSQHSSYESKFANDGCYSPIFADQSCHVCALQVYMYSLCSLLRK